MPDDEPFGGLVEEAENLLLEGDEVRADPEELGRLAQTSLDESIALFDALAEVRAGVSLPEGVLGDTGSAGGVAEQHALEVEAAGTAVERLISVLEEDMDALYQVAFAYQAADAQAGWGLSNLGDLVAGAVDAVLPSPKGAS